MTLVQRVKEFLRTRVVIPVMRELREGLTPHKFALTAVFGMTLGLFPIINVTTILCLCAAFLFRLNQPIIHICNQGVGPLQLVLLIPFIRAGEYLFDAPELPLSLSQLLDMLKEDPLGFVTTLWTTLWHAIVAWLVLTPMGALPLYFILRAVFTRVRPRLFQPAPTVVAQDVALVSSSSDNAAG
ncbi:MAG: DUF2062 domain-containing protein [Myxococcota bacterium]